MLHEFSRTEMVIGSPAYNLVKRSKVAIIGIGGVGSFVAESLARSGVGHFVLCDDDDVCLTNFNRQIIATRSSVGKSKVEVMKERILDIYPKALIEVHPYLYNEESAEKILTNDLDYIVDAIDMVSAKLNLIETATNMGIPIISSMGTGNKLDPTRLEVADIYKTSVCPLARVMRKELRKRRVKKLKVVYSKEEPIEPKPISGDCTTMCICPNKDRTCVERSTIPGSTAFVPSVAGLIITSVFIQDFIKKSEQAKL
jgi:tRNA A37 threonylcarbamoyladenosine dehydratase